MTNLRLLKAIGELLYSAEEALEETRSDLHPLTLMSLDQAIEDVKNELAKEDGVSILY